MKIDKSEQAVSGMFNSLSSDYDRYNHLTSFNSDRRWTRRFADMVAAAAMPATMNDTSVAESFPSVLDVACGTAEISLALYRKGFAVTGLDISEKMIAQGRAKVSAANPVEVNANRGGAQSAERCIVPKPELVLGSAERIPFADASFDAVTVAYGVRNFNHPEACLAEMLRVLRPGGHVYVMEFAMPRNPLWRSLYRFYKNTVMTLAGKAIYGSANAFRYLATTVETFPQYDAFCKMLSDVGFSDATFKPLTGGITVIYSAHLRG
jgi:demethylmenaquinone methyltransferase/2-methoxy-6-polyprenyl-1,4-benzoquinol methylase